MHMIALWLVCACGYDAMAILDIGNLVVFLVAFIGHCQNKKYFVLEWLDERKEDAYCGLFNLTKTENNKVHEGTCMSCSD